jgi:hypothetical protein
MHFPLQEGGVDEGGEALLRRAGLFSVHKRGQVN